MTDRELDYLMRRVLLDSMEGREDTEAAVPGFTPSARHDREIRSMLADATRWVRRRTRPVWKSPPAGCRDPAGVYSEPGQPDGRQSHRAGRGCSLGDRMV